MKREPDRRDGLAGEAKLAAQQVLGRRDQLSVRCPAMRQEPLSTDAQQHLLRRVPPALLDGGRADPNVPDVIMPEQGQPDGRDDERRNEQPCRSPGRISSHAGTAPRLM